MSDGRPRPRRAAVVGAVLVAACLLAVGVGWATKHRCLDDGLWQGGEQFTELCYTDVAVLWYGRGLGDGEVPYLEADLEYPVLLGGLTAALAGVTRASGGGMPTFLALNALVAAVAAVAVLALLAGQGVGTARLWWWATAPPLLLYAAWNWDLVAVALLVAAIAAHRRCRPGTAGILAGLGAATKLFPALLVPVLVVAHLRSGRPDRAVRHAGAAAAAWLAVNLPVAVASPSGWWHFYAFSIERSPNAASSWSTLDVVLGGALPAEVSARLSPVALLVGGAAILAVGTRRLAPADTWRLVLPLTAWFLLANKVHSPQFDLWLVPLVLLVLPRLAPLAALFAANLVVVVVELRYLGGRTGAIPALGAGWLAAAVTLRAAVLVWIIAASLRTRVSATSAAAGGRPTQTSAAPTPATAGGGTPRRPGPPR